MRGFARAVGAKREHSSCFDIHWGFAYCLSRHSSTRGAHQQEGKVGGAYLECLVLVGHFKRTLPPLLGGKRGQHLVPIQSTTISLEAVLQPCD